MHINKSLVQVVYASNGAMMPLIDVEDIKINFCSELPNLIRLRPTTPKSNQIVQQFVDLLGLAYFNV